MRKQLILMLVLGVVIFSILSCSQEEDGKLKIYNKTGYDIVEIYVYKDENDMGSEKLGDNVMAPNEYVKIDLAPGEYYVTVLVHASMDYEWYKHYTVTINEADTTVLNVD